MRKKICSIGFIPFFIISLISCNNEKKNVFTERDYIKKLRIEKIVGTKYSSKFGKIDYTNGFISEVYTYDTNGIVIKEEMYFNEEYSRELDHSIISLYNSDYSICRTEEYDYKNNLKTIYIDSLTNFKTIERKVYDKSNQLKNLIKFRYDGENEIEAISYDANGKIDFKRKSSYMNKKQEKHMSYDSNGNVYKKVIADIYDNYTSIKEYDEKGKVTFSWRKSFKNGLMTRKDYTYHSIFKENDSTLYREEYTYQDSILYKQKLKYKDEEIESAIVYTIYKRK
jgi:hypothetical protein